MKQISKDQINIYAAMYGGKEDFSLTYPQITFQDEEYGFEATEEMNGQYSGWKFFGPAEKQAEVYALWSALTDPDAIGKEALTPELASKLTGRIIEVEYFDYNKGRHVIEIIGQETKKERQIGQDEHFVLNFKEHKIVAPPPFKVNGKDMDEFVITMDGLPEAIKDILHKKNSGFISDDSVFEILDNIKKAGITLEFALISSQVQVYVKEAVRENWLKKYLRPIEELEAEYCPRSAEKVAIDSSWIYEWQGVYRRGSGAERLFVTKIII